METTSLLFGLPPIVGLLPLLIYIILCFKQDIHPVLSVAICVLLGAVLVAPTPLDVVKNILGLGSTLAGAMSSFLVLVGLMILLGSGLGMVLRTTGVAENIVFILVKKIGVSTKKRAVVATIVCSIVMVVLLGNAIGANAIIAPIIIPLLAAVGIAPSTLAIIFQTAGQAGLLLGPFTPPMITLIGITGLTYPQMLLYSGLPLALVLGICAYVGSVWNQKRVDGVETFAKEESTFRIEEYKAAPKVRRATTVFLLSMLSLITLGIITRSGATYVLFVSLFLAVVTGLAAGMKISRIITEVIEGSSKMMWIFFMFLLFEPFLNFVVQTGGFAALVDLLQPAFSAVGKIGFTLLTCLAGIFGINGAMVAQSLMIDQLFKGFLPELNIGPELWGLIVFVGSQITSFAYPGVDMLGSMGLAKSSNPKATIRVGYTLIIPASIVVTCLLALVL